MEDRELALKYAPIIYFDSGETIFPRAVGYTIFTRTARSASSRIASSPISRSFIFFPLSYYFYRRKLFFFHCISVKDFRAWRVYVNVDPTKT